MTDRQTVAGAYQKIESHEELCAERYRAIFNGLGELKADINGFRGLIIRAVVGVIVTLASLVGWMAIQLWDGQAKNPPPSHVQAPR